MTAGATPSHVRADARVRANRRTLVGAVAVCGTVAAGSAFDSALVGDSVQGRYLLCAGFVAVLGGAFAFWLHERVARRPPGDRR